MKIIEDHNDVLAVLKQINTKCFQSCLVTESSYATEIIKALVIANMPYEILDCGYEVTRIINTMVTINKDDFNLHSVQTMNKG